MTNKMAECLLVGCSHYRKELTKAEFEMLKSIVYFHLESKGLKNVNVDGRSLGILKHLKEKGFISDINYNRYYSAKL